MSTLSVKHVHNRRSGDWWRRSRDFTCKQERSKFVLHSKRMERRSGRQVMAQTGAVVACLFLAFLVVQPCQSSGFGGCECNILGACDINGNKVQGLDNKMTGYAPIGIEQFAYATKQGAPNPNLAYLCEGNTVAILYDCNARIPLYAATVMTAAQLIGKYNRPPSATFRRSEHQELLEIFQQGDDDYNDSNKRNLCYESRRLPGGGYFVESEWYKAAANTVPPTNQPCTAPYNTKKTPVHRGHLIAARYGGNNAARVLATFTYTNVVPQFGTFNSGQWNKAEGEEVVKWSRDNCAQHGGQATQNARIFIVVGAIPSTYGTFSARFFGQSGFSDYQGWSVLQDTYGQNTGKKEYRVNVPRYMWTAVCCTFQYLDANKHLQNAVRSVAFYRGNEPRTGRVDTGTWFPQGVNIFPNNPLCNNYNQWRLHRFWFLAIPK